MYEDQDIITLDSDDEADMADLVVGPTGTAVPINEVARLNFQAGIQARPSVPKAAPVLALGRTMKLPKKPGLLPPFALFSQERRDQVLML